MGIVAIKEKGGADVNVVTGSNKMKAKSNEKSLYRIKINNIFESHFPGSCTKFDDLFSSV